VSGRMANSKDRYSPLELECHLVSSGDFERLEFVLTELSNTFSCFRLHFQQNWSVMTLKKTIGANKYSDEGR
jgi:hypothetical protein